MHIYSGLLRYLMLLAILFRGIKNVHRIGKKKFHDESDAQAL